MGRFLAFYLLSFNTQSPNFSVPFLKPRSMHCVFASSSEEASLGFGLGVEDFLGNSSCTFFLSISLGC